jgi:hypothetical protein
MQEEQKGLQPHEVRVVQERTELMEKITKLHEFMKSDFYRTINEENQLLFKEQEFAMRNYADTLLKRINLFEGKMEHTVPVYTAGQKAAGVTFNPSNLPNIDKINQFIADIIDIIHIEYNNREISSKPSWNTNVFRTQAFTSLIVAQMAAVKFITYKD